MDARLTEVLQRLFGGIAQGTRDWLAAWQSMVIPADRQVEALQKLLNIAFIRPNRVNQIAVVVAALVKGHKLKLASVEEVLVAFGHNLDGILAMNEDAWHFYATFLENVFPKPADVGWGLFRVGWTWHAWWQHLEKCISSLDPTRAYDVLGMVLKSLQDKEGSPLSGTTVWSEGDKLQTTMAKLTELGSCSPDEVRTALAALGVNTDGM